MAIMSQRVATTRLPSLHYRMRSHRKCLVKVAVSEMDASSVFSFLSKVKHLAPAVWSATKSRNPYKTTWQTQHDSPPVESSTNMTPATYYARSNWQTRLIIRRNHRSENLFLWQPSHFGRRTTFVLLQLYCCKARLASATA